MPETTILLPSVRESLDAANIEYEPLECDPAMADTAEFLAHYGYSAEEACNAIVVALKTTPKRYVACLVRADTKLDVNHKLAAITGTKKMSFAPAEEAAALTGQMIGGVTVAGLPPDLPLYVDQAILDGAHVIIGGGNRSSKVRLAPRELTKLPNTSVVDIAVPR